jgi:ATP-dependent helicase HepA
VSRLRGESPPRRGTFVRVAGTADGLGKLVDVRDGIAEVEYFASPAGPEVHTLRVPLTKVHPIELSPQTRVYWTDGEVWRTGRVEMSRAGGYYHVSFPNREVAFPHQTSLYTRWAHPIEDPTDYLAARITDTPFFFDGRAAIVRYLAAQRANFGGLTGLASAAIELLEHQVTIVRRVLSDPVQRYLLADEVGLGKTIEAGILIRQHVIDCPEEARVLVVVPPHLLPQWRMELATKFFLVDGGPAIVLTEDAACDEVFDRAPLTMLVVDEAHRAALRAFSADSAERRLYDRLRELARRTPRLLLLSGTPVLHQEDGFLAMLHLLDPDAYPLQDRDGFRRRVRDRQSVAEAIADLGGESSGLFVAEAIGRLEHLFADDLRLRQLCRDARIHANGDIAAPARRHALQALRTHLTETYRLHRRLLRTRREDARLQDHLPRRTGVTPLEYEDPARDEAFDFVEAWRWRLPHTSDAATGERLSAQLCALWVESALSHPRVLLRYLDARLDLHAGQQAPLVPSARRTALAAPWAFEGEREFLRERRTLIGQHFASDPRAQCLTQWLHINRDVRKAVIFVDDSEVADALCERLRAALGEQTVVRHTDAGRAERSFVEDQRVRVIVCDARAEEGLNLQHAAAALVHYDLPLEPARLEQRIGRIDRIAARGRMRNVVLVSGARYEQTWLAYLSDAIRIFNRSVAPLQYVLAASTAQILGNLVVDGAEAIAAEASRMADPATGCDAELRRIRQQEALDALESEPAVERTFFEALTEADGEVEEQGRQAFDAWVVDCLRFQRTSYGPSVFRYVHDPDRPTLVPLLEVVSRFQQSIDTATDRPRLQALPFRLATFERHIAEEKQVDLVRVGHPFVDAMEGFVRADDRGTAYAMWRHLPNWPEPPQVFFRFDFVVEADLSHAQALLNELQVAPEALRRRAHAAFLVDYKTIWLNSDLVEVRDPSLIVLLEMPYSRNPRADGGSDVNLRLERWAMVDAVAPVGEWGELCLRARKTAERSLRATISFSERCRQGALAVREAAAIADDQLRTRIARLSGASKRTEAAGAELERRLSEALARGMESPSVRLDSAGAIYLAATLLPSGP